MSEKDRFITLIRDALPRNRDGLMQQWQNPQGTTTRHFILDNLLPAADAHRIHEAFPRDGDGFFNRDTFREKKRTSTDLSGYAPILSDITYALQDQAIVELIADMVGFEAIEPDPKLYAGGLSMMFKDDFLNPHIDNSHDGDRQKYRRLNLLYYVSPDWKTEYGGNLELWDDERKTPVTVTAAFNRLVVMETTKLSWHSVSPVVTDRPRTCVSNYYFSNISPDQSDYFHVTSFSGRPGETLKSAIGVVDNAARNLVSKTLGTGRGRDRINKT
ncbi:2OG-Fe(II) oxygenase [Asticcacaulis sp. ZE23SCel15]|uniref:2OG-Fe(II) oxygenase n=1 Tax=Asticcacaulis sp. ZE23SCel15 TaxID=3059027 RepID=UPI00265F056A|nr:2OG-Fe(II) oxygenase [Asticcacaulis sp. ZE23SCel15]WKL57283.1 2OG-Fe(II) oxygenase [Asticcacaulis sp. ZE23SCel15]